MEIDIWFSSWKSVQNKSLKKYKAVSYTFHILSLVSFYFSTQTFTVTIVFYVFSSQLSNMVAEVRPNRNKNDNVLFRVNSFHLQRINE